MGLANTSATPSTSSTETFSYNGAGQTIARNQGNSAFTWQGQPTTTTNFTHDQLNRDAAIAAASGYDTNGNLISDGVRTFTYDVENRLTSVTGGAAPLTISYDPLGRIAKTTSGSTSTDFLYDGQRLVAEYDSTTGALLRSYVHGTGTDDPLLWAEGGPTSPYYGASLGNDVRYLYKDRQGSIIGTAGTSGVMSPYTYGPYGEPASWAGSRFRYTGQIALPEAQLYHYKARVYDPTQGRFLQTDPIGYGDGMNVYAYVRGDPVNEDDPEGTTTELGEIVVTGARPYVPNPMNAAALTNQNLIGAVGLGGIGKGQVVPLSQASKLPAAPKEKPKTPAAKEKPKKGCPTAVVGKVEASIGLQLAGEVSTVGFSGGGVFDLGSLRAGWSSDDGFYTKGTQEFSLSGGILGATVTGGWKREGTLGTGANPGSFMNKPLSSVTDGEFKPFTIGGASLAGVKVEAGICVPQ